jgi:flavin reductase (DIM6/NTAB) family NADH-FMN oxidoreductase RutF
MSNESTPAANQDSMLPVLGRVPSGLYILTARGPDGFETGMLASWVVQAGFEPPSVTVAVKQGRYICEWLSAGLPFNLNVLGEDQQSMLAHFGRGFDLGQPSFNGLEMGKCSRGIAILGSSVGHLECTPGESISSGDHRIFLCRVTGGKQSTEARPMVHIRKSGKHY